MTFVLISLFAPVNHSSHMQTHAKQAQHDEAYGLEQEA